MPSLKPQCPAYYGQAHFITGLFPSGCSRAPNTACVTGRSEPRGPKNLWHHEKGNCWPYAEDLCGDYSRKVGMATGISQPSPELIMGVVTGDYQSESGHMPYKVRGHRIQGHSFFACAKSSCSKAEATISVSAAGIPRAVASRLHPETALATSRAVCRACGGVRRKYSATLSASSIDASPLCSSMSVDKMRGRNCTGTGFRS